MVAVSSFSGKDTRPPINAKATAIPQAPYPQLQSTGQREQKEENMFTGVQLYLCSKHLEIKSGKGTKVSQLGHPGESVGGRRSPAGD